MSTDSTSGQPLDLNRRSATVEHLQELYAIMAGIGLAIAMSQLIRTDNGYLQSRAMPLVAAYAITLVPFYHGALRHLDESYRHEDSWLEGHPFLLLGDFVWLFVEGGVFFAMASFIRRPEQFGVTFALLLFLDVAWLSTWLWRTGRRPKRTKAFAWIPINLVTVVIACAVIAIDSAKHTHQLQFGLHLTLLAIARTSFDYWLSRDFYFPVIGSPVSPD